MYFLLFLLCLESVRIIDGQNTVNETEPNRNQSISETSSNQTLIMNMERITQPMEVVMERTLVDSNPSVADNRTQNKSRLPDFQPSPHLGTFYERNTFPVKPAVAEAKTFGSLLPESGKIAWPTNNFPPSWTENSEYNAWTQNQGARTWTTPAPYQFDFSRPSGPPEGFAFNKPVPVPPNVPKGAPSFWDRFLGIGRTPNSQQKTFDYNTLEAPPQRGFYELGHQGAQFGGLGYPGVYGGNPWKKIIKTLAALIPIGLFISALTPTVITVSSTNDTSQSRYRHVNSPQEDIPKRLDASLGYFQKLNGDGCEDRVLCELLVSSFSSKNAEGHIQSLLDNFVNQEDIQKKKEDLLKVFEAVKKQDCSSILCGNIKNPT